MEEIQIRYSQKNGGNFSIVGPPPFHNTKEGDVLNWLRVPLTGLKHLRIKNEDYTRNHIQKITFNDQYQDQPAVLKPILVKNNDTGVIGQILLLLIVSTDKRPTLKDVIDVVHVGKKDHLVINNMTVDVAAAAMDVKVTVGRDGLNKPMHIRVAISGIQGPISESVLLWDQDMKDASLNLPKAGMPVWGIVLLVVFVVIVVVIVIAVSVKTGHKRNATSSADDSGQVEMVNVSA